MSMESAKRNIRPIVGVAIASLVICGVFFPLLITGIAQILFPYQANGQIVSLNGRQVGSVLIAQEFSSPKLLHPRPSNASASGVDPDIPLADALAQVPRIHDATGIGTDEVTAVIMQHEEGTFWIFGSPYVNVLRVNLALMSAFPSAYNSTST